MPIRMSTLERRLPLAEMSEFVRTNHLDGHAELSQRRSMAVPAADTLVGHSDKFSPKSSFTAFVRSSREPKYLSVVVMEACPKRS